MLSFLRTGKVPLFNTQAQEHAFYDELDYWMVPTQHGSITGMSFGGIDIGDMNFKH
jgi:hypothetical protein